MIFTFSWGLDLKLNGIWLAFGLANSILSVLYVTLIMTVDWPK